MRPKTVAIVPAAGVGRRLGLDVEKPFVSLGGKPLICRTLSALESSKDINTIVVAAERSSVGRLKKLVLRYGFKKVAAVVAGGRTRSGSVRNCLDQVGGDFDIALIHDGARPLIDKRLIRDSIAAAARFGAAIAAVPENDTVKLVDKRLFIKKTLDRKKVFRAQTPQAFRFDLIKGAYGRGKGGGATDDASLIERLGRRVKIVGGTRRNIKITTKEDLKMAKALL